MEYARIQGPPAFIEKALRLLAQHRAGEYHPTTYGGVKVFLSDNHREAVVYEDGYHPGSGIKTRPLSEWLKEAQK